MSDSAAQRFESLVQPHFAALYRAALRFTRRRHDAEDLVQEVCLRACTNLEELAAVDQPRAWLMRALYHLFVDGVRRRRLRSSLAPLIAGGEAEAGAASDAAGPERAVDAARMHEKLVAVWGELDPDQRALLALHAEGNDLKDLAAIFGSNKNALSARLHRARQRLAKLLAANERKPTLELLETPR